MIREQGCSSTSVIRWISKGQICYFDYCVNSVGIFLSHGIWLLVNFFLVTFLNIHSYERYGDRPGEGIRDAFFPHKTNYHSYKACLDNFLIPTTATTKIIQVLLSLGIALTKIIHQNFFPQIGPFYAPCNIANCLSHVQLYNFKCIFLFLNCMTCSVCCLLLLTTTNWATLNHLCLKKLFCLLSN